jgi:transcriptional regulator with XRE-family HTH domain
MENTTTGKRIAKLREQKNVTQKELAEHLGISSPAVVAYEHDRSRPVRYLKEIADYFNVTVDYLLCKTDDPKGTQTDIAELKLLSFYRKLNQKGKDDLLTIAESFSFNPIYTEKEKGLSA